MTPQKMAACLRDLADELDPPTAPDDEPFLVRVQLMRDDRIYRERDIPLPNIGDGAWGHFSHEGQVLHDTNGTPIRRERWGVNVTRVNAEARVAGLEHPENMPEIKNGVAK